MIRARFALALLIVAFASIASAQTEVLTGGGSSGGGTGTVTSVAATVPSILSITGSPITTSGTLAITLATQAQTLVFAAPCSATGTPTFRVLCAADIPTLAPTKITGTAVITSDARLSDARTPTAHASTHAAIGSDPVTVTEAQVTGLVTDLSGKQASGNYITALTGDVAASGPGSVTATLATVNSNVGSFTAASITVDGKGRVTAASSGSAGIGGSTGATDNLLLASDGTGGATLQARDVSVSDATANVVTMATTAGNAMTVQATAPAQTAGSQAGKGVTITASAAVDGSSTHAAATGGNVTLRPGLTANAGTQGSVIVQSLGHAQAVAFQVLPDSGASSTKIFDNGRVVIDGDSSTASTMLSVQSGASPVAAFSFNSIAFSVPVSAGGGTFILQSDGNVVSTRDGTFRHQLGGGTSPSVAGSCGTSPTIAGKDSYMNITTGSGSPTSCVVTFGTAYAAAPACVANASTTTTVLNVATTTTTVTISTAALTAGEVLHVACGGF